MTINVKLPDKTWEQKVQEYLICIEDSLSELELEINIFKELQTDLKRCRVQR